MNSIFKYQLKTSGVTVLSIPARSKFLSAHSQNSVPTIWMQVITDNFPDERRFEVIQTGDNFTDNPEYERKFIGTCLLHEGSFVLHVYELILLPF